ncbi:BglG family transcription antiterminator [Alkalihalobacillus sp. MEB130]|uniref:BglG family transcription antiterminator n=1 Tax=Alkalihalobacillus sp. MEB130 TaxID=2976704 RepID=UPI0028DF518B|nr:BglG family transcription antiterminator [Alkalihalobacillus sp. MEB130]MDT8862682.1 BglG family transcription antiterminator [Alkalihalobacillus sp. MEB130]
MSSTLKVNEVNAIYITARERQILEHLLSSDQEITVKGLAEKIDVSVRTVHRDLKGVEDILKEYDLSLLKKSGVGVQLVGSHDQIENLKLFLFNIQHNEYTPEERQTIILCTLLESVEPVKLLAIASDLNVTIATISNDLNKVEEQLQNHENLILVRKRGYGVEIVGDETSKRKAMSKIISENVDEFDLLSLIRENIQKKTSQQTELISERLLGLVDKRNLLIVEKAIEEINKELPYSIADSAYMGLVVHLALAMERILQGENISIDQAYLEHLEVTSEFKIAEKIIEKLEKVFQTKIPKAEVGYITMHLRGAKLRLDKEYLIEDTSLQIALKAKSLILHVEKETGESLADNHELLQGLVAHLSPALFRIKQNMGISNPLLDKIKQDYSHLFHVVQDGVKLVFPELEVPEEEIGYLVLHFGSVLLGRHKKESLKALIVCSSGIGTSKMLATSLQQEVPEIKECRNVSMFELIQIDNHEYDLILSTIRLPDFNREYILVNPILTSDEIEKIKSFIHKQKQNVTEGPKQDIDFPTLSRKENTIERMKVIKEYSDTIVTILQGLKVSTYKEDQNLSSLLQSACETLLSEGVISELPTVIHDLLEREKIGGLGIPNTKLALYHARSDAVRKPSFTIHALHEPQTITGMDQVEMKVETILLMLSPRELATPSLEILSQISAVIIENELSIIRFESKDENKISSYLASKLESFFKEKTNY